MAYLRASEDQEPWRLVDEDGAMTSTPTLSSVEARACLTVVVYLPPSYQGYSPCSGGPFEALLYLILFNLHFVLLVYSFSKQICFQSFPKLVNVFTVFNFHWQFIILYSLGALY